MRWFICVLTRLNASREQFINLGQNIALDAKNGESGENILAVEGHLVTLQKYRKL